MTTTDPVLLIPVTVPPPRLNHGSVLLALVLFCGSFPLSVASGRGALHSRSHPSVPGLTSMADGGRRGGPTAPSCSPCVRTLGHTGPHTTTRASMLNLRHISHCGGAESV